MLWSCSALSHIFFAEVVVLISHIHSQFILLFVFETKEQFYNQILNEPDYATQISEGASVTTLATAPYLLQGIHHAKNRTPDLKN